MPRMMTDEEEQGMYARAAIKTLTDIAIKMEKQRDILRAALKDIIERQRLAYNSIDVTAQECRAWDIPADIARAALKGAE